MIGGLHKKLCALKVAGVPVGGISGLPCGSPGTKSHLDVCRPSYGQKKGRESNCQFERKRLPTTQSRESTLFTWLQATCDIWLESSRRGLQLCFRSHCNRRFTQEVMRPQSYGSPLWRDFGTPMRESRDKKPFGCDLTRSQVTG